MGIQKFQARNMNEGLRLVRDTAGPDALIIKTLKRNGRVELFVEVDDDIISDPVESAAPLNGSGNSAMADSPPQSGQATPQTSRSAVIDDSVKEEFRQARIRMLGALGDTPSPQSVSGKADPGEAVSSPATTARASGIGGFDEILNSLRQGQPSDDVSLSGLRELVEDLQLGPGIAAQVRDCHRIDELIQRLAGMLHIVPEGEPATGIRAFVGPSGSGKTTTLTKIVTRHVIQFGPQSVAIIGCDRIRAGALDQLNRIADILDVPFLPVSASLSLEQALAKVAHRQLVVIDMPGMSMRDPALASLLDQLSGSRFDIKTSLVLPANIQADVMKLALTSFRAGRDTQLVLTRLDECCNLGPAISMLASSGLPLAYTTAGPHVPEDLEVARAVPLVRQAVGLLREKFAKLTNSDLTNKGSREMVSGL
ncbi:MAG: hypothetical protein KDI36_13400 [Pseudomonadales bacterium]|nr:hypothetical protein [Pseudomonadales bacterium]